MSDLNRREALRAFLRGVLRAGGTAVLAAIVVPAVQASTDRAAEDALQQRADRLAAAAGQGGEGDEEFCRFVNGGFVNGGFKNAGSSGGSAFKNGTFNNGGSSAFKNGSASGGTFNNGGFKNG